MSYNPFQGRQVPRVGQFPGPFAGPSGVGCDSTSTAMNAAAAAAGQAGACRIRRAILGLETVTVVATSAGTSSTQPQKPFRGLRLVLPSLTNAIQLASLVDVTNVTVSMMPQLASNSTNQPIPGSTFQEASVDAAFDDFDWCPTSEKIKVEVFNLSANNIDFKAALLGLVLES